MIKLLMKPYFIIILCIQILFIPNVYATSLIENSNYSNEILYPTINYNLIVKNNVYNQTEVYRYEFLDGTGCVEFTLKSGIVDSYTVDKDYTNLGSIIYKDFSGTKISVLGESNSYSYVTLLDPIEGASQSNTGVDWASNCAPTAAITAYNWANGYTLKTTDRKVEQVIEAVPYTGYSGKGYRAGTVHLLLDYLGLDYEIVNGIDEEEDILQQLNAGNIIYCSVNSEHLEYKQESKSLIGKTYSSGGGHALLITGYLAKYNQEANNYDIYFEYIDSAEFYGLNQRFMSIDNMMSCIRRQGAPYYIIHNETHPYKVSLNPLDTIKETAFE